MAHTFASRVPGALARLALAWLLGWAGAAGAEAPGARVALVVGNGAYAEAPLRNPVNDARAMSARLGALGFEVMTVLDADQQGLERAIVDFARRLDDETTGLFYYAGHGLQVRGHNYLLPVDASIGDESDVRIGAVDVDLVLSEMEYAGNRVNIVILDACRNNPFERRFRGSASRGLAAIDAARGTLIAYATAPGAVAADGEGDNGLYTDALLSALEEPGLAVEEVFKRVRVAVADATRGQQVPWESSSLTGDFVFNVNVELAVIAPAASAPVSMDGLFWESIRDSDDPADFEAYLEQFPDGTFAVLARNRIAQLERSAESRGASSEGEQRVERLLALADADVTALRLTSPAGNNAVEKLREVLRLEPGNVRAHAGLARVVSRYLDLADRTSAGGDFDRARGYVERAERVAPGSEAIAPARARIEGAAARAAEREAERVRAAARPEPPAAPARAQEDAATERRRLASARLEVAPAATPSAPPAAPAEARPRKKRVMIRVAILPGRMGSSWNLAAVERVLRWMYSKVTRGVMDQSSPQMGVELVYRPSAYFAPEGDMAKLDALWGGQYSSRVDAARAYGLLPELGVDVGFAVHVATGSTSGGNATVTLVDPGSRAVYTASSNMETVEQAVAKVWREFAATPVYARLAAGR